jgi:hypothetical protein
MNPGAYADLNVEPAILGWLDALGFQDSIDACPRLVEHRCVHLVAHRDGLRRVAHGAATSLVAATPTGSGVGVGSTVGVTVSVGTGVSSVVALVSVAVDGGASGVAVGVVVGVVAAAMGRVLVTVGSVVAARSGVEAAELPCAGLTVPVRPF